MKAILLAVILAILAACVPWPFSELQRDAEEEYYRGLYDVCVVMARDVGYCLKAASVAREHGWYEQPSVGWEWPTISPTLTPSPSTPTPALPLEGEGVSTAGNIHFRQ